MMSGQTPVLILKEGTRRERGRNAQENNIAAAKAIADAIRSTLGPKGMDKMLVDSLGDVVITNDGVTILKEIDVEHPAAKMMIEVAKTQDDECGDGTTTAVILAGELLKKSEELIEQNVHPTIISHGFRLAADHACDLLEKIASDISISETEKLETIAKTSMNGKAAAGSSELLADIAVRAVTAVAEETDGHYSVDLDNIQVEKKQGGSVDDTEVIEGLILDKEPVHPAMPKHLTDAKIALVNSAFEVKKTEVDAKIEITDPTQLQAFLDEEEHMLKSMVNRVVDTGANVLICQKGIDDLAQHYLAKADILAIRRAKKSDMGKLAKATGARIVTNLEDLTEDDLGAAGTVDLRKVAGDDMTFITHCENAKAVSVLIRGGTEHVVSEIERGLHDALSVVKDVVEDGKYIIGGAAAATEIALELRDYASTVGGREQLAIEAYANAVDVIPRTLAENAGLDPINTLIDLRKAHKEGNASAGVNVMTGEITDMEAEKVIEPLRVGKQGIQSATDAAVMILRIDDVIAAKAGGMPGGMPGGPGGMPEDY